ncbi:MAG: radical SAM protein [Chitinivibrionales bacterium]|nr:radical SAM protein [Chitinivibrionales bacterium]
MKKASCSEKKKKKPSPRHKELLCVVSDAKGAIFEIPEYRMTGMHLQTLVVPRVSELLPLPFGSDLFMMPKRHPIVYNPITREHSVLSHYRGVEVFAVSAFMAPAYVQVLTTSYEETPDAPRLPLFSYTAVGWCDGQFYVPAIRIDADKRQDLENFDLKVIHARAKKMASRFPENRLVQHLVRNCVLRYGCPAARNFAMSRWECPLPTSHTCNAACLGCISLQSRTSGFTAAHDRMDFTPTGREIAEVAVHHIEVSQRPVVSFGQGCEGEPLMEAETIEEAVTLIRKETTNGIINLNTNASKPKLIERLFKAGLDSIRVSMNSAQAELYRAYFRPKRYGFDDVVESLKIARHFNKWSSINYFVFPGLTDDPAEIAALEHLIGTTRLNMIQARNLNIDPQVYRRSLQLDIRNKEDGIGIKKWVARIRKEFPWIKFGYFNPPLVEMKKKHYPL